MNEDEVIPGLELLPDDPRCGECRFWGYRFGYARCQRHAPVIVMRKMDTTNAASEEYPATEWPNTSEDDWCGDFEREPEE